MTGRRKRISAALLAAALSGSLLVLPAGALEYNYSSTAPGQTFYRSTSTDANHIADSSQIVVGMDGTISSDVTGQVTSSPLSALDLPVGDYPDSWGITTDIAIAQNSVFPNEIGPTTETTAIYTPSFLPSTVNGGLPRGGNFIGAGMIGPVYGTTTGYAALQAAYSAAAQYGSVSSAAAQAVATATAGAYAGIATSTVAMPTISSNGAIGQLSIPSVGLNKWVFEGTTTNSMIKGLGHFDCTSGWLGNVAMAGHNRSSANHDHFRNLKDVKIGDTVYYKTAYGTATYVVTDIDYCSTTDTSGLLQDGTNKLTMYTCKQNDRSKKLKVTATMVGMNA